jgi:hypothetical protein
VVVAGLANQPFQRFPSVGKPSKRLSRRAAFTAPLKRDANKRGHPLSPDDADLNKSQKSGPFASSLFHVSASSVFTCKIFLRLSCLFVAKTNSR